ncbi:MAG: hypothetical protein ACQES0_00255 [Bacteroidota bacterium]
MYDFKCPHCNSFLNVDEQLILSAEKAKGDKGLVLLNTEPGSYDAKYHPDFSPKEGEKFSFKCPVCHADLTSDKSENLAKVVMVDEKGKEYDIHFSKIKGEKSTYKIIGETVETYGTDKQKYINFFNLSQLT